jgi:hypothetical protein
MKCIECNNEFNSVNNRGVEQKYCSLKCRNKSAFKRREQRLKNTYFSPLDNNNNNINTNEKETQTIQENVGYRRKDILSGQDREDARNTTRGLVIPDNYLSIIKELYEAKNETIFYKLKCEQLEKELNDIKIENARLEADLDEYENEDSEGEYSGMLGGIMEQFKSDPTTTINFTTDLINNLFKKKV